MALFFKTPAPWLTPKNGIGYYDSDRSNDLLEGHEFFGATDIICEGPIEGLCDAWGNTLKLFRSDETPNHTNIILGKGVYFNNVAVIDSKLNKFNFTNGGFKISYGKERDPFIKETPSTVYRYNQKLYDCVQISDDNTARPDKNKRTFAYIDEVGRKHGTDAKQVIDRLQFALENTTAFTHRIKNKYCNRLSIHLTINSLQYIHKKDGTKSYFANFGVEISESSSLQKLYLELNVTGISSAAFVVNFDVGLNLNTNVKNEYIVKIFSTDSIIAPTDGEHVRQTSVASIIEYVDNRGLLNYPFTALVKSGVSSRHFSSDPARTFDIKMMKVKIPNNYDAGAKVYHGIWDGTFAQQLTWTDNPAWIFYDICTNARYGLGKRLNENDLDKWELYKIAKYCDEQVKTNTVTSKAPEPFICFNNSVYILKKGRSLEQIRQDFNPILNASQDLSIGENTVNSGALFYDINYINKTGRSSIYDKSFKSLIYSIDELDEYDTEGQQAFLALSAFFENPTPDYLQGFNDRDNFFKITMCMDFSPDWYFNQDKTGAARRFFDSEVKPPPRSESAYEYIKAANKNTENYAKQWIAKNLNQNQNFDSYFFSNWMHDDFKKAVDIDNYLSIIFFGKMIVGDNYNRPAFEPRFVANVYIDGETQSLKLLNDLASTFRGIVYSKNQKVTTTIDVKKSVSYLFNNTNVKDGLFSYGSGSVEGAYSVAKVLYKDAYDNFSDQVEIVEDAELIKEYGIVIHEILGFGITSKSQARRTGEWSLLTSKTENQTINFSTDMQAILLNPGDVIEIQDQYKNNNISQGRILDVDYMYNYIVIDRKIPVSLIGKRIVVTVNAPLPSEIVIENESQIPDATTATVEEFIIERIENNTNRIYISEKYNISSFSKIVKSVPFIITDDSEKVEKVLYKVVTITENDYNDYAIFAMRYDLNKYNKLDSGVYADKKAYSDYSITYASSNNIRDFYFPTAGQINWLGSGFNYAFYNDQSTTDIIKYAHSFSTYSNARTINLSSAKVRYFTIYFDEITKFIQRFTQTTFSGTDADKKNALVDLHKKIYDSMAGFLLQIDYKSEFLKYAYIFNDKNKISDFTVNLGYDDGANLDWKIYITDRENRIINCPFFEKFYPRI